MQLNPPLNPTHPADAPGRRPAAPLRRLVRFLLPGRWPELPSPPGDSPYWIQTREQLLTGILRFGAIFGTPTLLIAALPYLRPPLPPMLWFQILTVGLVWVLAIFRAISYRLRAAALMLLLYLLGLNELLHFGYGEDASAFLTTFALLALVFFSRRAGALALACGAATLAAVGSLLVSGSISTLDAPLRQISTATVLVTPMTFLVAVGTVQIGVAVLLDSLQRSWRHEHAARGALEQQRDLLEQRVDERTRELALARDQALAEVAERKQAQAALQQFAHELQAHNADLDAFAHTVAHDLKIPLTGVIGYSQLLQISYQDMPPEQVAELLDQIAATGRKMNAIINGLLLLARVRTLESVPVCRVPTELVLDEAEQRLRDQIAQSGATIVRPERWPAAIGYAPWVEEVWVNYLSNALKYGGRPPRIVLGADAPAEGRVRFWVQDNGPGLSEQQRARLFAPFARLDEGRAKGHGLGLSIVERIVRKLGGEVGVESAPGAGCRFFFSLPAEHTGAAPRPGACDPAAPPGDRAIP